MNYADPVQAKIHRERVKRRQAEVRRDEWREKYRALQEDRLDAGDWPAHGTWARRKKAVRLAFLERHVHSLRTRNGQLRSEVGALRLLVDEPITMASLVAQNERLKERVECERNRADRYASIVAHLQTARSSPLGSFAGYR